MNQASQIMDILKRVKYRDWEFRTDVECQSVWLQCVFPDRETNETQFGRKWRVSLNATLGEIVQTALMAVLAAEEHEVREKFTLDGAAIFHPHHRMQDLLEVAARTEMRTVPQLATQGS